MGILLTVIVAVLNLFFDGAGDNTADVVEGAKAAEMHSGSVQR